MKRSCLSTRRLQTGFTLVEALVTFLILAIGLLGLAGLQAKGLTFDQSAYQRTQAALLAGDIADRMRANVTTARVTGVGGYNIAFGATISSAPNCIGASANCSTANMSQFDLDQWKAALKSLLPSGDGAISTAANAVAPMVDVTITVYWDELRNGATGIKCPRLSDSDLMCFQLQVTL